LVGDLKEKKGETLPCEGGCTRVRPKEKGKGKKGLNTLASNIHEGKEARTRSHFLNV